MEIPRNVRRFEWLMYGSFGVGLVYAPFNPRFYLAVSRYGFAVYLIALIFIGILIAVVWAIARRRQSWLRYVMLALFFLGLISYPETFRKFSQEPIFNAITLLGDLMHGIAYYFIFTGDAVPWFENRSPDLSA